jgi:hypothetical protein
MRFLLYSLWVVLILVSCKKDEIREPAPADASIAKYVVDGIKEEIDHQLNLEANLNGFADGDGPRGGCATVSISPSGNVFPKTVTITFPQNCTTYAGARIEGTVSLVISGKVREAGTTVDFTLKDFKYKTFLFSGKYHLIFNGGLSHTTTITDGVIVNSDGKTITYNATNNSTQIEGMATTYKTNPTTFLHDDVYEISTTGSGINTKGNNFTIQSKSPLVLKISCQWLTTGIIEITEDSTPSIKATLDYGDNVCDNQAVLTFNNLSRTISLP